ncbi:pyrroloquinoline quinone precursor peptide PqqA [Streptomyces sp. NPDC056486]
MNDDQNPTTPGVAEAVTTVWQTPEYEVVETALEVTAYRSADR